MKKNIAPFWILFFVAILLLSPGCIHRKQIDRQKLHIAPPIIEQQTNPLPEPPPITIWVHGTLIFYRPTYHDVFDNKSLLVPAQSLPEDNHFRILAQTITKSDPHNFPLEEFYIFGWSGKLQDQERILAAKVLYDEITTLTKKYLEKYGCSPKIRIIAHSHGGNVALNMAAIKQPAHSFQIKSLILLACPVQDKTMHLISTPMFQRVYSLYSSLDIIQIIAPQFQRIRAKNGRRKKKYAVFPFSARVFPTYSHLTQTKIKINDLPISHTRFSTSQFVTILPPILHKLDSWHTESLITNKISKHKLLCVYNKKK